MATNTKLCAGICFIVSMHDNDSKIFSTVGASPSKVGNKVFFDCCPMPGKVRRPSCSTPFIKCYLGQKFKRVFFCLSNLFDLDTTMKIKTYAQTGNSKSLPTKSPKMALEKMAELEWYKYF